MSRNQYRNGAVIVFLVAVTVLLVVMIIAPSGGAAAPRRPESSATVKALSWIVWCLGLLLLGWLVALYGTWLLRRRNFSRITIEDSTARPVAPRPRELAFGQGFARLGFGYLGELQLSSPFASPTHVWIFYDPSGSVRGSIHRPGTAFFSTRWLDGASLSTAAKHIHTVETPLFLCQYANGFDEAYRLHLQSIGPYSARHGAVAVVRTMAQVVAGEEQDRTRLIPDISRHWRVRQHVLMVGVIILAAVVSVTNRPF